MRRRHFLAAGGAVGVAGCLRLTADDDGAEPTPAVTPTRPSGSGNGPATVEPQTGPATAGDETLDPGEYPFGVDEDGLSAGIVDTHLATLADTSFTVRLDHESETRDWLRVSTTTTYQAGSCLREFHPQLREKYSTDGRTVWRRLVNNDYTYGKRPIQVLGLREAAHHQFLLRYIDSGAFDTVQTVRRAGTNLIRATAAEPAGGAPERLPWLWPTPDRVESYTGEALILPDGVIDRFQATVEVAREGTVEAISTELETRAVGRTSLSAPSWTDTARDRAPEFEARLLDDRRFLRVDHLGGVPVPAGSEIDLHGNSAAVEDHITNEQPITEGDRIWLWRDERDAYLSRGTKPSVTPEPLDPDGWLEIQDAMNAPGPCRATFLRVDYHEIAE